MAGICRRWRKDRAAFRSVIARPQGPKIVFHAKVVAALREILVARGASFGKDPDGNPIQLSNR